MAEKVRRRNLAKRAGQESDSQRYLEIKEEGAQGKQEKKQIAPAMKSTIGIQANG